MKNNNHTFYFIQYPPGAGGSHLANLMSLEPSFCPKNYKISKTEFIEYLDFFYSDKNSQQHIENHTLVCGKEWKNQLKTSISYQASVHIGHVGSYYKIKQILNKFCNKRKYICLGFNSTESVKILRNREKKIFETDTLSNQWYLQELSFFYSNLTHEKTINKEDVCIIDFAELCVEDIKKILKKINNYYNLQIPYDMAQRYHNYWFKKNF